MIFSWLVFVVYAIVMLCQLHILIRMTNVDSKNRLISSILDIFDKINNLPILKSMRVGGENFRIVLGGMFIATILTIIFWMVMFKFQINLALIASVMSIIKCFGYLLFALISIQTVLYVINNTTTYNMLKQLTDKFILTLSSKYPIVGLVVTLSSIFMLNFIISKVIYAFSDILGTMWVTL